MSEEPEASEPLEAVRYQLTFRDGRSVIIQASAMSHDMGLMMFFDGPDEESLQMTAGVNVRELLTFKVLPEGETEAVEDQAPMIMSTDLEGLTLAPADPDNEYVRKRPDLTQPVADPFRGGKLKEKK